MQDLLEAILDSKQEIINYIDDLKNEILSKYTKENLNDYFKNITEITQTQLLVCDEYESLFDKCDKIRDLLHKIGIDVEEIEDEE